MVVYQSLPLLHRLLRLCTSALLLYHCPPLFTTTIGSTVRREKHVDKSTIISAEEMEGLRRINAWDIKLYGKSRDGVPILVLLFVN
jgi:hypothetical protein